MAEENISQKFRLKNRDETRNCLVEEIKQMSKNHKKVCTALNHIEHFLTLASTITGCISDFAFFIGIPIEITSSAIGLKILV